MKFIDGWSIEELKRSLLEHIEQLVLDEFASDAYNVKEYSTVVYDKASLRRLLKRASYGATTTVALALRYYDTHEVFEPEEVFEVLRAAAKETLKP